MKNNLWVLMEEKPKTKILKSILKRFARDYKIPCFIDNIRVLPLLNEQNQFTFTYEVIGLQSKKIDNVFIKTISGSASFVDFLIYYQRKRPTENDDPIYAIEETKTDDSERRNTGIYQRASKFVYIESFYPSAKKIMLYNLQIAEKANPTKTNIFGTKCLLVLGVDIMGKKEAASTSKPFSSIDELIDYKDSMKKAPRGNVPIEIKKYRDKILISGRLIKSGRLAHDPNIGALTLICATLRKLGWSKKLILTRHGLSQKHITGRNKCVQIAHALGIEFDGLKLGEPKIRKSYWHYEKQGEKLGTIFIHLVVENFSSGESVFENHAGCEKGYFITKDGEAIALKKYRDRTKYKNGDKKQIIQIPDLILIDFDKSEIINIEGKKYKFRSAGIDELQDFDAIEDIYIKPNYPNFEIVRTLVVYGSKQEKIMEMQVGFLLNENGKLILGVKAPDLFKLAIKNLLDYWEHN